MSTLQQFFFHQFLGFRPHLIQQKKKCIQKLIQKIRAWLLHRRTIVDRRRITFRVRHVTLTMARRQRRRFTLLLLSVPWVLLLTLTHPSAVTPVIPPLPDSPAPSSLDLGRFYPTPPPELAVATTAKGRSPGRNVMLLRKKGYLKMIDPVNLFHVVAMSLLLLLVSSSFSLSLLSSFGVLVDLRNPKSP